MSQKNLKSYKVSELSNYAGNLARSTKSILKIDVFYILTMNFQKEEIRKQFPLTIAEKNTE